MRKIVPISVGAIAASLLLCSAAWPCKPATLSVVWPLPDQKGVPLNARVVALCIREVCPAVHPSLADSNGRLVRGSVQGAERPLTVFDQKHLFLTPARHLRPNSSYTVLLTAPDAKRTQRFETGQELDQEPPSIAGAEVAAEIAWIGDRKAVLLSRGATCGPREYDIPSAKKAGWEIGEGDYLPEHYNIVLHIKGVTDDTGLIFYHLFEIEDDGGRKDLGQFNVPIIGMQRIDAKDIAKSKRYEVEVEDPLGNVQSERIGFQIRFDRSHSSLTR